MLKVEYRQKVRPFQCEVIRFDPVIDYQEHPPGTHKLSNPVCDNPIQVYYEEITPNSEGSQHNWKSFQHYKMSKEPSDNVGTKQTLYYSFSPFTWFWKGVASSPYMGYRFTYGSNFNLGLKLMYDKQASGDFVTPPADLDSLVRRAMSSMLPSIKPGLSLVNSLIELKDFRSLVRSVRSFDDLVRTLKRFSPFRTLRQIFRVGADSYLQGNFNIAPLLADISGLRAAIASAEKQMNDLLSREGKPQKRHWSFSWAELENSYEVGGPGGIANIGVEMPSTFYDERYVSSPATQFHAEIEYNFNYTDYQREHARLLSLLDYLGLNLNPAIIWNAIPWSFVVDWIFSFGRYLDSLKTQNMEPTLNIRRFLWSVTRSRSILVTKGHYDTGLDSVTGEFPCRTPLPVVQETAYRREVGLPSRNSIESSGINFKEFTLGAALITAISGRRHRKQVH